MARSRPVELELRDVPWSDVWRTIANAAPLVSPKVGLIKTIHQSMLRAQDPVSFSMGVGLQDLARYSEILNSAKAGGGGEAPEIALVATLGEAVERYCMLFYDKAEMVFGSRREIGDDAVEVDDVRFFSRQQIDESHGRIAWDYFTEDSPIYWVWGYSLTHRRRRLVPACQVYLNYKVDEGEACPGRNASTGLAAGATLEEAILSGLFEVVERDAFAIAWHHRRVGPRIRIDDPVLEARLRKGFYTDHPSVDLRIFDISLDLPIPAIFAMMRRPTEFGPALCLGSVARLSYGDAIRKGLRELGQAIPYLRFLRRQLDDWQPAPDFSDVVTFDHHFTLYLKRPELAGPAMSFCDEVEDEVPLSKLPDRTTGRPLTDIERCLALLAEREREVIVVDITTDEVRECGFRVVRVLVPGLVPIHGNHNHRFLGLPRLHHIPHQLGWAHKGWSPETGLNPFPHPFP